MSKTMAQIGLCWCGFVVLLGFVPWQFPPSPDLPNMASLLGYNVRLAYLLIVGWVLVFSLVVMALNYRTEMPGKHNTKPTEVSIRPIIKWSERIIVAVGVTVAYWPASLSRYGPYLEDEYFLNVLWRMRCGELPYIDFEFLYGPLMIMPLGVWTAKFGYQWKPILLSIALHRCCFSCLSCGYSREHCPWRGTDISLSL